MKKAEGIGYYTIIRVTARTEAAWLRHVETVEEYEGTWSDFVAYAKRNYSVLTTDKRKGFIKVA